MAVRQEDKKQRKSTELAFLCFQMMNVLLSYVRLPYLAPFLCVAIPFF